MRIWKHFFFSFIRTVWYVLCLLIVLYLIITYIENSLYYFKKYNPSAKIEFLFYFWQIPDIALQILPFAVLIAGIILNWSLSRSGEVAALQSAGMSLWRMSFPFICGAFFYAIIHLFVSEFIRPTAYKNFYNIKDKFIENISNKNNFIETNWVKSQRGILHFEEYNPETKIIKQPEFFVYNDQNTSLKYIARSDVGFFDDNKHVWVLNRPTISDFENPNKYTVSQTSDFETDVHFAPPKILKKEVNSDELSYFELLKFINEAQLANVNVQNRLIDLYLKISQPFSNVIFVLFTVPFALQRERKESSYFNILLCLSLTITYWFGNLGLKNLSSNGYIPPIIAAWGLNVLFGFFAGIVISKLNKPA